MNIPAEENVFPSPFEEALQGTSQFVKSLFQWNGQNGQKPQELNPFDPKNQGDQGKIDFNFTRLAKKETTINAQQAAELVTVLTKLPPDLLTSLSTIPNLLPKLITNGQAEAVADMIGSGTLSRNQRTAVINTAGVQEALIKYGQQAALDNILRDLGLKDLQPSPPGQHPTYRINQLAPRLAPR